MVEREQRVTPLELFFDVVFVFAITQVTLLMSAEPTWRGLGRGMLVLAALWWSWTGYAWLTNTLKPEEGWVRAGIFAAMAALLVVALTVPEAFDANGVLFGVAYFIVRLLHIQLYTIAGKRDPDLLGALMRIVPSQMLGPLLIIVAAFFDGAAQAALWVIALAIDYIGVLIGRGEGWRISPSHFAERHGLIVIIALGESIVSIGVGAAGEPVTARIVAAAVLGILVITTLWWAYFDVYAVLAERQISQADGDQRVRLARDVYSYIHLPMIAGIVLFALGLKKTIEHVGDPLDTVPAVALCGGLSLYFFSHVALRIRLVHTIRRTTTSLPGWIGPGRLVTGIAALALLPLALEVSALTALAFAAAVCAGLVAYDLVHYREDRVEVRSARP